MMIRCLVWMDDRFINFLNAMAIRVIIEIDVQFAAQGGASYE